jgi:hypothetical protein
MALLDLTHCEETEHPENFLYVKEISIPRPGYVRLHFAPAGLCLRSLTLDLALQ